MALIPSKFESATRRLTLAEFDSYSTNLQPMLLLLLLASGFAAWLAYQVVPTFLLMGWVGASLTLFLARLLVLKQYFSQNETTRLLRLDGWRLKLSVFLILNGALWGSYAWVVIPELPLPRKFLVTWILVAWAAAEAVSIPPTTINLRFCLLITLLPPAAAWIKIGNEGWVIAATLGGLIVIYDSVGRRHLSSFHSRQRFSRELARANTALEESNLSKTRLLIEASHDLRQPVHALGMMLDQIKPSNSREDLTRRLSDVQACVDTIADMLIDVMDMSSLEAGEYAADCRSVEIAPILRELENTYKPMAQRKGLQLIVSQTSVSVTSDPAMLRRILGNLVSNAIKYTFFGCVGVSCSVQEEVVKLKISDTGIGIPPDKLDLIFQEFVRLDEVDDEPGHGLGLAVVKRMTTLLGHQLKVKSKVAHGSAFELMLQRAQSVVPASTTPHVMAESFQPLRGRVIIFLDDDDRLRRSTAEVLSAAGATIVAASNIGEAMMHSLLSHQLPNMIISDMHLNGKMNGLEAITALRAKYPSAPLPAILLTGDLMRELSTQARAMNVRVIYKPVRPARLQEMVTSHMFEKADSAPAPLTN